MERKQRFFFTILFILLLMSVGLNTVIASSNNQPPIIVGFNFSMTGIFSSFMEDVRRGAEMAVEEINAAGGVNGREIKLILEDDASVPATGIASFKRLLHNNPEMIAVIGSSASNMVLPLLPYVRKAKIAYLSGASSLLIQQQNNPYFFRTRAADDFQAPILVKFIVEDLGKKNIALLYCTDEFGFGGMEQIKASLKEYGIEPLYIGGFSVGDTDFSGQLNRAASSGADTIIGWSHALETGLLLKQMYEFGFKESFDVIAGGMAYGHADTIDLTKEGTDHVYSVIDNIPQNPDPDLQRVRKAYREKYNDEISFNHLCGYDEVQLIVQALKKMDTSKKDLSREEFRDALASIKNYKGVLATWSFDKFGNGVHEACIAQVIDGATKMIKIIKE